ncbi:MBL fold metallo-hydrolase [Halodesulfurarchaeum sp.]|uniref:MBL fold metallo-hydrolase n=1 Tax=Halodesulfurarchaeum sp. TaxID=1980530 RepID=UPI002FC3987B
MTQVRLNDGIRIKTDDERAIAADAGDPASDVPLLSHAHGDHLYDSPPGKVVASDLTRELAAVRRDGPVPDRLDVDWIEQLSAGHVPGSRAFVMNGDQQILYTGDCSTRDRFEMEGFDPVSADVLVIESTYGKPEYTFPAQSDIEAEIVDWLEDTRDRPVILLGYALGRAQELIELAARAGRDRIRYTPSIDAINDPIEAARGKPFPGSVESKFTPEPGDALVLPAQTGSLSFIDGLREKQGAILAGFSGWAIDKSYRFARDLDVAFPLSDHCDFEELLGVVERVNPDQVYTVHGFVDDFAGAIQSRLGIQARAVKPNQTTLGDF